MNAETWLLDDQTSAQVGEMTFQVVRKGYDPIEVDHFVRARAADITRLQDRVAELEQRAAEAEARAAAKIDERVVAQFLGEESSRLLITARETANDLITRAERNAEDLREQVEEEAQVTRDALTVEVARERGIAREQARRLIVETREHRSTVLADLAHRRDLACAQLADLLRGREVLLDSLNKVARTTSGLMANLDAISADPASFVNLDPAIEGPGHVLDENAVLLVTQHEDGVVGARGEASGPRKNAPLAPAASDDEPLLSMS